MTWNTTTKRWTITQEQYKELKNELKNTKDKEIRTEIKDLLDRVEIR